MITITEQQHIINSLSLSKFVWKGKLGVCRCPICGDSKKKVNKKRGHFILSKNRRGEDEYFYYCHNCGVNFSFFSFLKEHFPEKYRETLFQFFQNKAEDLQEEEEVEYFKVEDEELKTFIQEMKEYGAFVELNELDESHEAVQYLKNRKIEDFSNFYYTENFYGLIYLPLKVFMEENTSKFYTECDKRIFWFVKNRLNEIIGLQARSLDTKNEFRYLTVKLKSDEPLIGNLEQIDINSKVFVTEGFLDSLFLPNCVSMSSLHFQSSLDVLKDLNVSDLVFVFDNEPFNKYTKRNIERVIDLSISLKNEMSIGIVLFPSEIRHKGKDVNDYVRNLGKNKLLNIIKENTFYDFVAKTKFIYWG